MAMCQHSMKSETEIGVLCCDCCRQLTLTPHAREQLQQINAAGAVGVESGDLINKPMTRALVRERYVRNSGGPPSSLSNLVITLQGQTALREAK